jgi:hypothetical protein
MATGEDEIINKVNTSGLLVIDLGDWYDTRPRILIDLKDFLWQGIAIKEKEYREQLKNMDWSLYNNSLVAITCSEDALIPTWAYMLIASKLQPYAAKIVFGTLDQLDYVLFENKLNSLDIEGYKDKKIVIKGCGKYDISPNAYMLLTQKLQPMASSIMFGEPCSTVPIYKKKV